MYVCICMFSFHFDTTQNHIFLPALNTKNAVSLSQAAQTRAWNSLLTESATLRLLCARRSGLAERRPESRLQTIHNRRLKDRSDTKKMMARPETNKQHPKMSWIARRRVMRVCVDVQ